MFLTDEEIEIIFGSTNPQDENAKAGKVQFGNAYFMEADSTGNYTNLPDWSAKRLTAVSASIAVNRQTRTASDKKLFHQEYVPAGITFKFELSGNDYEVTNKDEQKFLRKIENYSEKDKTQAIESFNRFREENNKLLDNEGIKKLLILLRGFAHGARIGAETSDADNGWGKLQWSLTAIKRSNEESIKKWLEDESAEFLQILPNWEELQKEADDTIINPPSQTTNLRLILECADDFLVNDPCKTKRDKNDASDKPNHSPLRNKDGKPILPKSSFKGAVRSQAERILRTMAITFKENISDQELKKIACYPDDMSKACPPIKDIKDLQKLCLACQIFGASGWKSIFSCSDFIGDKTDICRKQIERGKIIAQTP